MIRVYEYGLDALTASVIERFKLDENLTRSLIFNRVSEVFTGQYTLEYVIPTVELRSTTRRPLVRILQEFDQSLTDSPDLGIPDAYDVDENGISVDDAKFIATAKSAWERLSRNDTYIDGIFSLTLLVGIFLSSYTEDEVDMVDFTPLFDAYEPLQVALRAKEFEHEYENNS